MKTNLIVCLAAILISSIETDAQEQVYLFGGQSNMWGDIVSAFRNEILTQDPAANLTTPRYRNPGMGLDSGWDGKNFLGYPPGPGRGTFYAGTGPSDPNIGNGYSGMLNTWQNAISEIEGDYEIKGFVWVQGEQDAKDGGGGIAAGRYGANLSNLISRIHEDLGLAPESVPFYYTSPLVSS